MQFASVDFTNGIIELTNLGTSSVDLDRWRFCTHDFDTRRRYTFANGLNGLTVEPGTSVFLHVNNDAPSGDPDRRDISAVGGNFATPFGTNAFALQIFYPAANNNVSFGNSELIADHLQWKQADDPTGQTEDRTDQAVATGVWSAEGDFVIVGADAAVIRLIDASGDEAGSPSEYAIELICQPDVNGDGALDIDDFSDFVSAFFAGSTRADQNVDGLLDIDDFSAFVSGFFAGC